MRRLRPDWPRRSTATGGATGTSTDVGTGSGTTAVGVPHRRTSRLRLRTRVMLTFSLILLAVTALSAVATWYLATNYMLSQRERSATRQAAVNARFVEGSLQLDPEGLAQLVAGLSASSDSAVLVLQDDAWLTGGAAIDPGRIPRPLLAEVTAGRAASQRTHVNDAPVLIVGQPMPAVGASYIEVFPLRELDHAVRFLSATVLATALASSVLGAALGLRASKRALRPLADLNAAVRQVVRGERDVRVPGTADPDLAPLAAAFSDTAAALQRRVERDARFASDVSHELRSPLTTMVNAMAVLTRRRNDMPASARAALDLLAGELHRFERLVSNLLEISRTDQKDDGVWEPVDLVELLRHAAPGVDVTVDLAGSPGPLLVRGDRRRLERVVANLTDNAERHGQGVVQVTVSARGGSGVRLEIDDAGPGVAVEDRERVFERFARGSAVSRTTDDSGTGLGLALAAEHVRRHRGRIWVEDRPGGGARFVVDLPRVDA